MLTLKEANGYLLKLALALMEAKYDQHNQYIFKWYCAKIFNMQIVKFTEVLSGKLGNNFEEEKCITCIFCHTSDKHISRC